MKILLASSSSGSRGGGELFLLYLGEALVRRRHEVTLWASLHPRMDELAAKFQKFGKVIRAEYENTYDRPRRSLAAFFDKKTPRRVSAQWRQLAPDCIHINKQNLEDGLDLLHAAARAGIPGICTIHLTQSAKYLRAKTAFIRDLVARRALKTTPMPLVTVLENRRRDLIQFLRSEERVHLVPNGVPLANHDEQAVLRAAKRAELNLNADTLLVVGVGRMMPQKRPLLFLQLAEKIHAQIPNTRFAWIGDGALSADWDKIVRARNLSHFVSREPWQHDVRPFLAAADVFLHTAEYEGLPLALLEAMAAGLPCAITENLFRDMPFLNSQNAISIGDDDAAWLARTCDRRALAQCGAAARALIEDKFSCDAMAAGYEKLYEKVCAS